MILKKTGTTKGASFYQSGDGKEYQLRVVDRRYPGKKNPPIYYLEKMKGGKAEYLSGLFKTKKPEVFSFDLKDSITGVRRMYNAYFKDEGDQLEISPRTK